ncbi:unnamed protein product [Cuscuta epithymum]|uniref:Epidermal patterning factor-like protein n=1 Tax=Cuscuta epithymum TaxID=186058 RepID=A0AAV0DZE0_9ASTE|nr:unnamed protein product [Cuscuta epithymum]
MRSAAARTVGLLIFLISGHFLIITTSSNGGGGGGGERGLLMGSRPPRCQRRCVSCQECEAIQVPTNPQNSKHGIKTLISSSSSRAGAARAARTTSSRGDDDSYSSNYKPMSWKCKCGNVIFNP